MADSCVNCSSTLDEGCTVCANCGTAVTARPSNAELPLFESFAESKPASDLNGLGGWLIAVTVVLLFSTLSSAHLAGEFISVLDNPDFKSSSLAAYFTMHDLLSLESITYSARLIGLVSLIVLFLKRKRTFPKYVIAFLAMHLCGSLIELRCARLVFSTAPEHPWTDQMRIVGRDALWPGYGYGSAGSFTLALVSIPYFLRSRRVKTTFVR